MPRVPQYEQQLREAAPRPVMARTIDVSSGLTSIARAGVEIADEITTRRAIDEAETADVENNKAWNDWDIEARQKYVGKDADGYAKAAEEWWTAQREHYGAKLSREARQMISHRLASRMRSALDSAKRFEVAEKERHADSLYATGVDQEATNAARIGDIAGGSQRIRDRVRALGARKHLAPEQIAAEERRALTFLHENYASRLMQTDATGALAYLTQYEADIDEDRLRSLRANAERESAAQFGAGFVKSVAGLPYSEQVAKAEALKDPEQRASALHEVDAAYARDKRIESERQEAAREDAFRYLNGNQRVPESVYARMEPEQAFNLREAIKQSERNAGLPPKVSDTRMLFRLNRMTPQQLGTVTEEQFMAEFAPYLNETDRKAFVAKIGEVARGGVTDSLYSDEAHTRKVELQIGLDPNSDKPADVERITRWRQRVDAEVSRAAAALGRKLKPEEKMDILNRVAEDVVWERRTWGDKPAPIATLSDEELSDSYFRVETTVPTRGQPRTETVEVPWSEIGDEFKAEARILHRLSGKSGEPLQSEIAELYVAAGAAQGIKPRSIVPEAARQQILAMLRRKGAMPVDARGNEDLDLARETIIELYLRAQSK